MKSRLFAVLLMTVLILSVSVAAQTAAKAALKKTSGAEENFVKTLGSSKAPITIEVFSDFQCPACREFYMTCLRRVITEYVNKDKVYLVHHDFPLRMHPYAREAARYAIAASSLNKYEQVSEALYAKQGVWSADGKIEPILAETLSPVEMKKVKQVLENSATRIDSLIERDIFLGTQSAVNQTPTMVIRHKDKSYPQAGAVNYSLFSKFLDDLLTR